MECFDSAEAPVETYTIEFADADDSSGTTWSAWATLTEVDASTKANEAFEWSAEDNKLRRYRVFATNDVGTGPETDFVIAKPSSPLNVTGVIGLENTVGAGQVALNWNEPVNHGGFAPTHYVVDRISQSDSILTSSAGSRGALSADGSTLAHFSANDELKIYDTSSTTTPVLLGSWPATLTATAESASNSSQLFLMTRQVLRQE